jgi:kynurenine formamidase
MKKIIDLTVELYDGLQTWYIHPKISMIDYHQWWMNKERYKPPCEGFSTKLITFVDHVGTHVDAQKHFYPKGDTIESLPLDRMIGEAVLLDVSFRDLSGPVTAMHLQEGLRRSCEKLNGGDILLFRAWPLEWGVQGFNESRGLTSDAVDWILQKNIKMVGTDLAGIDDGEDWTRPAHCKLLKKGIPIVENLINLDKVGKSRFEFLALPLRLKGATGSPIRAVAVLD